MQDSNFCFFYRSSNEALAARDEMNKGPISRKRNFLYYLQHSDVYELVIMVLFVSSLEVLCSNSQNDKLRDNEVVFAFSKLLHPVLYQVIKAQVSSLARFEIDVCPLFPDIRLVLFSQRLSFLFFPARRWLFVLTFSLLSLIQHISYFQGKLGSSMYRVLHARGFQQRDNSIDCTDPTNFRALAVTYVECRSIDDDVMLRLYPGWVFFFLLHPLPLLMFSMHRW